MFRVFAGIPGFGLLYSVILLLVVIPMAMIYTLMWGVWPWSHSVGFEVRIAQPAASMANRYEERVIITVQRAESSTFTAEESQLHLNSRPVSWGDLRDALRAELSRSPNRAVYVEGHGTLEFADIVRVIDIAREAWPAVPVVLLTPEVKKNLGAERGSAGAERSPNVPRAAHK